MLCPGPTQRTYFMSVQAKGLASLPKKARIMVIIPADLLIYVYNFRHQHRREYYSTFSFGHV